MASPLPNTNAPAFRKKKKMVETVVTDTKAKGAPENSIVLERMVMFFQSGALTHIATEPERMMIQTFSFWVHAVAIARTANNNQSK